MDCVKELLSDTRKNRSLRRPDLPNKECEVLGVENCNPKSEQQF
jgi:hypothetical protein